MSERSSYPNPGHALNRLREGCSGVVSSCRPEERDGVAPQIIPLTEPEHQTPPVTQQTVAENMDTSAGPLLCQETGGSGGESEANLSVLRRRRANRRRRVPEAGSSAGEFWQVERCLAQRERTKEKDSHLFGISLPGQKERLGGGRGSRQKKV